MKKTWHYKGKVTDVIIRLASDSYELLEESRTLGRIAKKALIVMWIALGGIVIEDIWHFGKFPWHFWVIEAVVAASCTYSIGMNMKRHTRIRLVDAMRALINQLDEVPVIGEPEVEVTIEHVSWINRVRAKVGHKAQGRLDKPNSTV